MWAWNKLSCAFKMLSPILAPHKIGQTAKADHMLEAWEDRVKKLEVEYGEEIKPKLKIAVLYAMLPKDLQDRMMDHCGVNWEQIVADKAENLYTQIKTMIVNLARSRRRWSILGLWRWMP